MQRVVVAWRRVEKDQPALRDEQRRRNRGEARRVEPGENGWARLACVGGAERGQAGLPPVLIAVTAVRSQARNVRSFASASRAVAPVLETIGKRG